jgi:hypothetical protein
VSWYFGVLFGVHFASPTMGLKCPNTPTTKPINMPT